MEKRHNIFLQIGVKRIVVIIGKHCGESNAELSIHLS